MTPIDSPVNPFQLLRQRRFMPFFLTQFLGAFNDNVFKNALIILIVFQGAQTVGADSNLLTNLSAALFILPFFLFSATAGQWIEKNEKSFSIRSIKQLEVVIMLCAAYAFYVHNIYLLIVLLFFMGSQSTLFGPAKYSYIPQHLNNEELVGGNALVQMGTFVAILIGTMLGGILISYQNGSELVAIAIVGLSIAGYLSSRLIPVTPSPNPTLKINWNPITETCRNIAFIYSNRTVFLSVLGISWFWFIGASYLVQLPNYTRLTLGGNEQVVTLLLTLFTLGIGCGSILCNWLSGRRVELGLVPLGSIGLTVFGIDLFFSQPDVISEQLIGAVFFLQQPESYRIVIDILFIGIFGGLYIVPLFSLVQQRSEPAHLSRVIAGNNIINALLMVLSAITAMLLLGNGVSIPQLFMVIAVLNAAVGIYIFYRSTRIFYALSGLDVNTFDLPCQKTRPGIYSG